MRFKFLSLFAATVLLAACSSTPEDSGQSTGSGASSGSQTTTTTATTTTQQPTGPKAGSQEDLVVSIGDRVFFDYDQYNLNDASQATLKKQAAWLAKYPGVSVTIEGHCDERGTREYNLGLGERRASATRDFLVGLGVQPSRIKVISYGKERPVALGHNHAAWAQNRRSVTMVSGG